MSKLSCLALALWARLLLQALICGPVPVQAESQFSPARTEDEATSIATTVELKSLSSADFVLLIKERHWLSAAQTLLTRLQAHPADFSAAVRSAVSSVRKELDDLIRSLDKSYGEAAKVTPAFQWAQNSSHIFLQVKFAQRWNAPGALEVENSSVAISDCCFSFQGYGEHSMIRKEYKLFLQFLEPVSESGSAWHFASAGRLSVTIAKARARKWERLLRSEHVKPDNMGVWQDMQETWKSELAGVEKGSGSPKVKTKRVDDEDDDDDEEVERPSCPPRLFSEESKVIELCPKAFLMGKPARWVVLFYATVQTSKQDTGRVWHPVWRAMAASIPSDVKVGAVDCYSYQALCEAHGATSKKLPLILRFQAGASEGSQYKGDPTLEDLAAWATRRALHSDL